MTPTPPRSAAIYCRISQDREGAGLGVERQESDCRELAESLGVRVVAVHVDNDLSAYSGKPRPGYRALLDSISSGDVGTVLCWHTDRLHRSPAELEEWITVCEPHGVAVHTVKAGLLDLATPAGRMVARQLGSVARYESEHKGERVSAARKQRVLAGKFAGGPRPFGFEADGNTIRPREPAEIVKATDALLAGAGLRGVVLDLNRRKVPTALGAKMWQARTLKDVLLRPRNAGLNVYQGQIVGPAAWDPIVPEPRWRALVALLTDKGRRTAPADLGVKGKVRWLGSGLYVCGVCGQAELRVSNNSRGRGTSRGRPRCWTGWCSR
jgi:site-specific DNA recombinase